MQEVTPLESIHVLLFSLDSFSLFLIMLCPNHSDPGNGLDSSESHCCSENKLPLQDSTSTVRFNLREIVFRLLPQCRETTQKLSSQAAMETQCLCVSCCKDLYNLKASFITIGLSQTMTVFCVKQWIAKIIWTRQLTSMEYSQYCDYKHVHNKMNYLVGAYSE